MAFLRDFSFSIFVYVIDSACAAPSTTKVDMLVPETPIVDLRKVRKAGLGMRLEHDRI